MIDHLKRRNTSDRLDHIQTGLTPLHSMDHKRFSSPSINLIT